MYWYILYVRSGREYKVEQFLKKSLYSEMFAPFVPLNELVFKRSGVVKKEIKPLFPSYVFVESELLSHEFKTRIRPILYASQDIVKLLSYSDEEIAMRESEKQMLMSLFNGSRCIEISSGIKEGNKIHIINGPLEGFESVVKKIDRHKRQAWVEMEFMGEKRLISVSLEIIEQMPDKINL